MQEQTLPAETRAVLNAAYRIGLALGRKFEREDMTIELRQAAVHYAATYTVRPDNDEFMGDMQALACSGAFLSDGQAKGVLNVLMADARRRLADRPKTNKTNAAPAAAPQAPAHMFLTIVPDGRYRVTLADGSDIALKLTEAGKDSKLAGCRVISTRINGDEWMGVAHLDQQADLKMWRSCSGGLRTTVRAAIDVLDSAENMDGWLVAGLAFARQGSECFICGRDLDTPESLTAGYGPVCAEKNGLPWGLKASPPSAAPTVTPVVTEPLTDAEDDAAWEATTAAFAAERAARAAQQEETEAEENARYWATAERAKLEGRSRRYDELFPKEA